MPLVVRESPHPPDRQVRSRRSSRRTSRARPRSDAGATAAMALGPSPQELLQGPPVSLPIAAETQLPDQSVLQRRSGAARPNYSTCCGACSAEGAYALATALLLRRIAGAATTNEEAHSIPEGESHHRLPKERSQGVRTPNGLEARVVRKRAMRKHDVPQRLRLARDAIDKGGKLQQPHVRLGHSPGVVRRKLLGLGGVAAHPEWERERVHATLPIEQRAGLGEEPDAVLLEGAQRKGRLPAAGR